MLGQRQLVGSIGLQPVSGLLQTLAVGAHDHNRPSEFDGLEGGAGPRFRDAERDQ